MTTLALDCIYALPTRTVKKTNSKDLKLKIEPVVDSTHHRSTPYSRSSKPASDSDHDRSRQPSMFKDKIINRFVLGKNPYTQLIVGLNGLEPEILLTRQDDHFNITWEELQELKLDTKTTLSSKIGEGATLNCRFNPKLSGGAASFERVLDPYTYPSDFDDGVMSKFELSRYELQQLKIHLPNIKTSAVTLIDNKPVFETMYGLIASAMEKTYKSLNSHQYICEMYNEVVQRFKLCVPAAFMVREFLSLPNAPLSPFQLYQVFEVCSSQHVYLKKRLDINSVLYMDWK